MNKCKVKKYLGFDTHGTSQSIAHKLKFWQTIDPLDFKHDCVNIL